MLLPQRFSEKPVNGSPQGLEEAVRESLGQVRKILLEDGGQGTLG